MTKKIKVERSMHSNDCGLRLFGEKTQEDFEKEFGINAIRTALKNHGWNKWQWHIYTKEDIKKHEYLTNFVEAFGHNFHGYIRSDSRISLKDACQRALNIAMRFNQCEIKTGHKFKPMKGYTNGLIQCVYCGFWGYTNRYALTLSELNHFKFESDYYKKAMMKEHDVLNRYGLGSNGFGGLLIRKSLSEKQYDLCERMFITDEFLKDMRAVFTKHGLLKSKED